MHIDETVLPVNEWLMALPRDSLRADVRQMKDNATVIERTNIEERRRKLEGRIKAFHKKADILMVGADLDDVVPTVQEESKQLHEWDDEEEWEGMGKRDDGEREEEVESDDEVIGGESGSEYSSSNGNIAAGQANEDEEVDSTAYPERLSLCMPSALGKTIIDEYSLGVLALQEIELRMGQANDALADLRVELGHKALLFRTKVRYTKNTKGKTRAWKEVAKSSVEVMKHVRCYERARRALVKLGADNGILHKYQDIKTEDLKMSKDILEENRYGQKNASLAWFWRLGPQGDSIGNEWMDECECLGMMCST